MNNYHILPKVVFAILIGSFLVSCAAPMNYLEPDAPKFKEDFAATPSSSLLSRKDTIKVITFNIAYAKNIDRAIHELGEWPELQDADILLLQEMDDHGTKRIAQTLQYNYVYYPASVHPRYDKPFGNAILSKWPISVEAKIILPHTNPLRKQRRIAVSATISIGNDQIKVYNIHTETPLLSRSKRLDQVKTLIEYILDQNPLDYIIVGGDFNTAGRQEIESVTQLFNEIGLKRATKKAGATSKFFLTVDHIYIKGLHVIDTGKGKKSRVSDHFPVWVLLKKQDSRHLPKFIPVTMGLTGNNGLRFSEASPCVLGREKRRRHWDITSDDGREFSQNDQ